MATYSKNDIINLASDIQTHKSEIRNAAEAKGVENWTASKLEDFPTELAKLPVSQGRVQPTKVITVRTGASSPLTITPDPGYSSIRTIIIRVVK